MKSVITVPTRKLLALLKLGEGAMVACTCAGPGCTGTYERGKFTVAVRSALVEYKDLAGKTKPKN